jgi:hypothetical protein
MASLKKARILRAHADTTDRTEIPVNLGAIVSGKGSDVTLQAGDILFIPGSFAKKLTAKTIESGFQVGTGLAIWRF